MHSAPFDTSLWYATARAAPATSVLNDTVDAEVCGTGAYTDGVWPGLRRSFTKLRVAVLATQPLSANLRGSILPANTTLVDTQGDPSVVKFDGNGRLVTSIFVEGRRGRDPEPTTALRASRLQWIWPQIDGLRWDYHWFGDLDMQPRTIPRLFELAPGIRAGIGLSGRGVPTGTMLGTVLADWAGEVAGEELPLPVEPLRRAPLYMTVAPRAYLAYARLRDWWTVRREGTVGAAGTAQ